MVLQYPPRDVEWRRVRPRGEAAPVHAWRAEADQFVDTAHGRLRARGGEDMIVVHEDGARAVVRGDIFERTYEALGGGLYRKRSDLTFRYFTLDRPALVRTLEGDEHAEPGDWIMEGVVGELWPAQREEAERKYRQVR